MSIKSLHSKLFEQRAAERRQELLESLATGHGLDIYWRLVGQVQGIDDALKMSEEADFKLSGDRDVGA